jgi:hypothetical protein
VILYASGLEMSTCGLRPTLSRSPDTLSCKIARFRPYYLHRIAECPSGACAILFRLPIGAIRVPYCLRMISLTLNDEGTGAMRLEPLAFDRSCKAAILTIAISRTCWTM